MYARHLRKIKWVQTCNPRGLQEREKHTFRFIAAGLKIHQDASKIKMSLGAFAAAQRNADLPGSPATVRRALAGLESKGFLWRRRCRLGDDRHGLEIWLNREHWTYWTQQSAGNVCPLPAHEPTSIYIPPRQSMRLAEENTSVINSRNININSNYARARGNNNFYKFLSIHPVLLTLWCLFKGSSDMSLFHRAETEVRALERNETPDELSGVPWEQYDRHWNDMTPAVKDSFAKSSIIPQLQGKNLPAPSSPECSPRGDDSTPDPIVPPPTEEERLEIRRLIEESIASTSLPEKPAPAPAAPAPENYPEIDLNEPGMKLLLAARNRARARCVDGS